MTINNVRRSGVLIASLGIFLLSPVEAWGTVGHQVVASVASDYLTGSKTTAEVARLLKTVSAESMVDVANWADDFAHKSGNSWAEPCHFFDMKRGEKDLRGIWNETCGSCCVIGAVFNYTSFLQERERYSDKFDADSLRFLVHYIGDVHQPLHVGHKEDRGGNLIALTLDGEDMNLHGLWDFGMIEYWNRHIGKAAQVKDWKPLAEHVKSTITADLAKKWGHTLDPVDWAIESHAIVENHVFDSDEIVDGGEVTVKYYDTHFDAVVERLAMGGVRLGMYLSKILNN